MFYANREEEARLRHRVKDSACRDCLFWMPNDDIGGIGGECRRHAPRSCEKSSGSGWWPVTGMNEWCGEFLWQDVPE